MLIVTLVVYEIICRIFFLSKYKVLLSLSVVNIYISSIGFDDYENHVDRAVCNCSGKPLATS